MLDHAETAAKAGPIARIDKPPGRIQDQGRHRSGRRGRVLRHRAGRNRLRGGRIGLGQVGLVPGADAARRIWRRRHRRWPAALRPQGGRRDRPRHARPAAHARRARQRDRHDLPGADDRAEPGLHRRPPADRRAARASRHERETGRGARAGTLARGAHPRARAPPEAVSARVVRRDAPARGDRHGHGLQAASADCGRTHHGTGRDDPGRDPRPDGPAQARDRHGGDVHHP